MSNLVTSPFADVERLCVNKADVKRMKLGQYVEVTICGYVKSLDVPIGSNGRPEVGLKVDDRRVNITGTSQAEGFKDLAEDDDPEIGEEYVR